MPRIFLCDDDVAILRAVEFKLLRSGFEVRTAGDGQEAWQQIDREIPDLLVTDCQMPRLDGLGLCARLRDDPRTARLPILMLTAKGFELDVADVTSRLGITAVIAKPFSPRELVEIIRRTLSVEFGPAPGDRQPIPSVVSPVV
jgi:two-component system alkaline phosphatase synthesis response regulator PhoP